MQIDPVLIAVVTLAFAIVLAGFILRLFNQPHVIGYILVGFAISVTGLVEHTSVMEQFANLGIIVLLFFIGMHVSIDQLVSRWRVAIFGTIGQILLTLGIVWLLGDWLGWPIGRIVLFTFVVTLSSTAVILKILAEWKELETKVGQNVLSILLVQDIAIIPMVLVLDLMKGGGVDMGALAVQLIGGGLIIGLVTYVVRHGSFEFKFSKKLRMDHEMQVFLALVVCFGFAMVTGMFGLSTALGAFIAGILVTATRGTEWIRESLESLHVILVALFFVYVGILIDLEFLMQNLQLLLVIVCAVLVLNTALNAVVLRILGDNWRESLYAGGLLSQIGEFSFLLVTIGLANGLIAQFGYQLMISTIAITLLLSPFWILAIKRVAHIDAKYMFEQMRLR